METDKLDIVTRILGYGFDRNTKYMDEIFLTEFELRFALVVPLGDELDFNIFKAKNDQEKIKVIEYYVNRFRGILPFFDLFESILFKGSLIYGHELGMLSGVAPNFTHQNAAGEVRKLNKIEQYAILSRLVYEMTFQQLCHACKIHKIDFNRIIKELDFRLGPISERVFRPYSSIAKEKRGLSLSEVWLTDADKYKTVLDNLQQNSRYLTDPFVTQIDGKLNWTKNPQKGWVQYLAGFVHTCIKNKWVADNYSAPEWKRILTNTFDIPKFDIKPFKSIGSNAPDLKYLLPFKDIAVIRK